MTIHPSTFPKRADGTRFTVSFWGELATVRAGKELVARCPTLEHAEMVAAALERLASEGETFDAEEKPCK